jgi:hypothetical protein
MVARLRCARSRTVSVYGWDACIWVFPSACTADVTAGHLREVGCGRERGVDYVGLRRASEAGIGSVVLSGRPRWSPVGRCRVYDVLCLSFVSWRFVVQRIALRDGVLLLLACIDFSLSSACSA